MPGKKITELTLLVGSQATGVDLIEVVDVSDTSMSSGGTNKKMTLTEVLVFLKANGAIITEVDGKVMLKADPTLSLEAATKQYVDGLIAALDVRLDVLEA